MIRIVVRGDKESDAKALADELGERLRAAGEGERAADSNSRPRAGADGQAARPVPAIRSSCTRPTARRCEPLVRATAGCDEAAGRGRLGSSTSIRWI